MTYIDSQPLGIIEGFFGREWSWDDRAAYANFLALNAFNFYIYAPKSDKNLRMQWQQNWPQSNFSQLCNLRETFRKQDIDFGIGLSPHEIYLDKTHSQRHQLKQRLEQINQLQPDILCILFDDMRGDIPNLAQLQIDIAHQAAAQCNAKHIIFCPTYYSFDPILEKVFGEMPANYWEVFAQKLDPAIDIFWTGEKVCSTDYSATHLSKISELIGRKPFLWDNYPVNDGASKSKILQLRSVGKPHSQLSGLLSGHAINPMNQAWLTQIPLLSFAQAYTQKNNYNPSFSFYNNCIALCGEKLGQQLIADIDFLQDKGLDKITEPELNRLISTYHQFPVNPFAREINAWLQGEYRFDPACLTE